MAKLATWQTNPSAMTRRLARYNQILHREMGDAVGEATYMVRDAAKRKAFAARTVGASDSITGRPRRMAGQSPVRTKVYRSEQRGTVHAIPHYTYARTRGLVGLLTRLGRRGVLTRPGLVVSPAKRGGLKGKRPRLIRFDESPSLKKWAIARKMIQRQKYWLGDAETIHMITTRPALSQNIKKVSALYDKAFAAAGARF